VLEIYNESIYDLLAGGRDQESDKLDVKQVRGVVRLAELDKLDVKQDKLDVKQARGVVRLAELDKLDVKQVRGVVVG